jgi:hypothetical protein
VQCEAAPPSWDSLCPDIKGLIFGHLCLRDLACAAPTSQDFRGVFLRGVDIERARLISVGEEMYGKDLFWAVVKTFRQIMWDIDWYPALLSWNRNCLIIEPARELELVTGDEAAERLGTDGIQASISKPFDDNQLGVELYRELPGKKFGANVVMYLYEGPKGVVSWGFHVTTDAHEAAVALILAICLGDPKRVHASLGIPPKLLKLKVWGLWSHDPYNCTRADLFRCLFEDESIWGAAKKRAAEDLYGPLRSLADSFAYQGGPSELPGWCKRNKELGTYVLGYADVTKGAVSAQ